MSQDYLLDYLLVSKTFVNPGKSIKDEHAVLHFISVNGAFHSDSNTCFSSLREVLCFSISLLLAAKRLR